MNYNENPQQAGEIIRLILPTLSRLNIPANPINFALWYEYYLGGKDELNAVLEEFSNGENSYTDDLAKDLFVRYIVEPDTAKIRTIGEEVRTLLSQLSAFLMDAGVDV